MSWNVRVTSTHDTIDSSIEAASAVAKSLLVDDTARARRDAVIDAQLAAVRAIADVVGDVIVDITVYGHINPDGTGSVGMSGSLTLPAIETTEEV